MKSPIRINTPVEEYKIGRKMVLVKREDLCSPLPGPQFSKIRGVWRHIEKRPEKLIGVLDTFHSKAGWAVAYVCSKLGKECADYYPKYKNDPVVGLREPQQMAEKFGATAYGLVAGRSCILFHQAKKLTWKQDGYMMPNALQLEESIEETKLEAIRTFAEVKPKHVVISISSGTIAKGVIQAAELLSRPPLIHLHMGYSRSEDKVRRYVNASLELNIIDEGYAYKDVARSGSDVPFPCNPYYDLKAWRWLEENIDQLKGSILFWNVGS